MSNKIASFLGNMSTGFLNNIVGGGFQQNTSASKVAAELLSKSPLEIDDSPQERIQRNPLGFSSVHYPTELASEEVGHYILFYSIQNSFGNTGNLDFKAASKVGLATSTSADDKGNMVTKLSKIKTLKDGVNGGETQRTSVGNSVLSKFPSHSRISSVIALYMPKDIKVSYGMEYEQESQDLSGTIAGALGNARTAESTAEGIKAIIGGVTGGMADYGKKLIGDALAGGLEAGDPIRLVSKRFGVAFNPHEEQFFRSPNFRSFTYDFEFWPKSREEAKRIDDIIFLFKYHMHPELDTSIAGGRLFKVPSEFEIQYAYLDKQNQYLNKISRCVLKGVDVSYGPQEQYSTFEGLNDPKGAPPVTTKMSLSFVETQFLTKQDIYNGY